MISRFNPVFGSVRSRACANQLFPPGTAQFNHEFNHEPLVVPVVVGVVAVLVMVARPDSARLVPLSS